jgi:hypothetical protein
MKPVPAVFTKFIEKPTIRAWMIAGLIVAVAGCSIVPSPLIVGRTYTNFDFEFSLDLPQGWLPVDDPETALENAAPWVDEDVTSLVLQKDESAGIIAVMNQKQKLDLPRYIELEEPYWQMRIDEMKALLAESVEVVTYESRIYKDNLVTTQNNYFVSQRSYRPEKVFSVDALIVDRTERKKMTFEWFLFPCQKDRSCQTIVMLACHEDLYADQRPAFDHVTATLRGHDYYN